MDLKKKYKSYSVEQLEPIVATMNSILIRKRIKQNYKRKEFYKFWDNQGRLHIGRIMEANKETFVSFELVYNKEGYVVLESETYFYEDTDYFECLTIDQLNSELDKFLKALKKTMRVFEVRQ